MKEIRYAVLVGMNNYKTNPLSYSVKDVNDVKKVLLEYCKFEERNIFAITNSEKPVVSQIQEALGEVQCRLQPKNDLLLFYYSGHGEYDNEEEKSLLYFEDETSLGVGDVVSNYFQPLEAKNNYLMIDACHSGNNVYVKSKHNNRKIERKLLNDSRELYFLFAAEENKKAFQNDNLQNSYYTYYFIDAIKNEKLYDDNGWLTMSSIDEHIRKKISSHKDVIQIPGSESRLIGYKPFAFLNQPGPRTTEKVVTIKKETIMENSASDFDLGYSMTIENRQKIQEKLRDLLQKEFGDFDMEELKEAYDITTKSKCENIPYEIESQLEKAIIIQAQKNGLVAVNN
jgi:hypothetical protein